MNEIHYPELPHYLTILANRERRRLRDRGRLTRNFKRLRYLLRVEFGVRVNIPNHRKKYMSGYYSEMLQLYTVLKRR